VLLLPRRIDRLPDRGTRTAYGRELQRRGRNEGPACKSHLAQPGIVDVGSGIRRSQGRIASGSSQGSRTGQRAMNISCRARSIRAPQKRPEALATSEAGDFFLCRPFLIHAAQLPLVSLPAFLARSLQNVGLRPSTSFRCVATIFPESEVDRTRRRHREIGAHDPKLNSQTGFERSCSFPSRNGSPRHQFVT
jgi:hypothetical protein